MQGIFRKENTDKALKYGIYRHLPTYEKIIRNLVSFCIKHYEMSDGTWKTDDYTYQYRLEITGRMNNAEKDSTFIFLSNIENITFDQAWKAAGFSSNMDDYFDVEVAKFVGMK